MGAHTFRFNMVTSNGADQISGVLRATRRHLSMDVGFVSEFVQGDRVFRFIDVEGKNPIAVGNMDPLPESYCHHVAQGLLPPVIPDARKNKVAVKLPATKRLPVGTHLSVPLRRQDGTAFGSVCCFSFSPNRQITRKSIGVLQMCADVVSAVLAESERAAAELAERRASIVSIIAQGAMEIAYQPLYAVEGRRLMGFEALARFPHDRSRPIHSWFAEADEVGLGIELEYLAVEKALAAIPRLDPSQKVTVNLSPAAIESPRLVTALADVPLKRVVVEMTEHAVVENYESLRNALAPHRARGLRLAIDDVGAGHSTFRHILDLNPDFIKLDRTLIQAIHRDTARRALAEALTMYARRIGCEVVAEGVEEEEELAVIQAIGITRVQGYLLGRPMPLDDALRLPVDPA